MSIVPCSHLVAQRLQGRRVDDALPVPAQQLPSQKLSRSCKLEHMEGCVIFRAGDVCGCCTCPHSQGLGVLADSTCTGLRFRVRLRQHGVSWIPACTSSHAAHCVVMHTESQPPGVCSCTTGSHGHSSAGSENPPTELSLIFEVRGQAGHYLRPMAKAYSATAVFPAEVWAATSTECPACTMLMRIPCEIMQGLVRPGNCKCCMLRIEQSCLRPSI